MRMASLQNASSHKMQQSTSGANFNQVMVHEKARGRKFLEES